MPPKGQASLVPPLHVVVVVEEVVCRKAVPGPRSIEGRNRPKVAANRWCAYTSKTKEAGKAPPQSITAADTEVDDNLSASTRRRRNRNAFYDSGMEDEDLYANMQQSLQQHYQFAPSAPPSPVRVVPPISVPTTTGILQPSTSPRDSQSNDSNDSWKRTKSLLVSRLGTNSKNSRDGDNTSKERKKTVSFIAAS
ncbi:hypothetical protein ADEAN_000104800 [Angomonas deanei]|uniref:Uncharacterized protein n=1 Tax=Angomonas deanei TaxID=59799 RepID=A0A7G2C241_9TRYP|nr:hypothetical protein ADEAN_000104800 [Angomonas deanei]